jgi:hypothetical protein
MNKAAGRGSTHGVEHVPRAFDMNAIKRNPAATMLHDDPNEMNHRINAVSRTVERCAIEDVANPRLDTRRGGLDFPHQGDCAMPSINQCTTDRTSDKSARAAY